MSGPAQGQEETQLRCFALIDRMQPQFAAYTGTVVSGDVPVAGMTELVVEMAPGNAIYRVLDRALKAAEVKPGSAVMEREFGMLELHAFDPTAVRTAGEAILRELGMAETDRVRPRVVSTQIIQNVDPYQAQLINKISRGTLLIPGQTLLVLEVTPAGYIMVAANEAEKAAGISLVYANNIGRYGRLLLAGSPSEVAHARDAAVSAIEAMVGR